MCNEKSLRGQTGRAWWPATSIATFGYSGQLRINTKHELTRLSLNRYPHPRMSHSSSVTISFRVPSLVVLVSALLFGSCLSMTKGQDPVFDPNEPNLAKEATVVAEKTSSGSGVSTKNLNDSNVLTIWKSPVPAVITLDLGEVKEIPNLELYIPPQFATPRKQEVEVKVSPDGSNYTVAFPKELQFFSKQTRNMVYIPLATNARYVQVIISSNNDGEDAILSEIRIPH